jgi:hypothetical protein
VTGTVDGGAATFASVTATGVVEAAAYTLNGVAQQDVSSGASVSFNQATLSAGCFLGNGIVISSARLIGFASITNPTSLSDFRVGFARSSNDLIELRGSTAGDYRNLILRNLTASGTVSAKQFIEGFVDLGTVSMYATIVITGGTHVRATLTSATPCTFLLPAPAEGLSFILAVRQAASVTTSATFYSFVGGVVWPGGVAPVMTPSPDRVDIFSFVAGRNLAGTGWLWHGSAIQDFTLT